MFSKLSKINSLDFGNYYFLVFKSWDSNLNV